MKEMTYSATRSSMRLAARAEAVYTASETDSIATPAFLRRKASEGQGRKPRKQ